MSSHIPDEIIPEHRLVKRIGRGSSGEVWLAQHSLGAWRAVKIVRPGGDEDPVNLRRELEGLRRYEPVSREHPGLLDILSAGTGASTGALYYVMELADDASGGPVLDPEVYRASTLSYRMRTGRAQSGDPARPPLPVDEVLSMGVRLAEGLAALHAAGLVHRDIKPGNIVFVRGLPCLADCGLVSASEFARSFVGTEGFIPPEGPGRPPADVYGLGKSLYEAAFGMDRCDWPGLPAWFGSLAGWKGGLGDRYLGLVKVLRRACATDASSRFQNAEDMAVALHAVRLGHDPFARRWPRLPSGATLMVGGVLMAMLIGVVAPLRRPRFVSRETQAVLDDPILTHVVRTPVTGRSEAAFYQVSGPSLLLVSERNDVILGKAVPGAKPESVVFQGFSDVPVANEGRLWISWKSGADCLLGAFYPSMDPAVVLPFPGQMLTDTNGVTRNHSKLDLQSVCDLEGDGRMEVVATLDSVDTRRFEAVPERWLIAFNPDTREVKWRVESPVIRPGAMRVVRDAMGRLILCAGTYAPGNGQATADLLQDRKSYAVAFDHRGNLLWKRYLGPYYSETSVYPVQWAADGETEIYCLTHRNADFVDGPGGERGGVYRFDLEGHELGRWEPGPELTSLLVRSRGGRGPQVDEGFVVADADGQVTLLNRDFKRVGQQALTRRKLQRVFLELAGEVDLDGDGTPEVVAVVAQCQPQTHHPNSSATARINLWHYEEVDLVILDGSLRELDRLRIADSMDVHPNRLIRLVDLGDGGRHSMVLMQRQPRVIHWGRRR